MKKKSILDKIIWVLNYLSAFVLLLSYTAPYLSPNKIWFIALIGLGQPFLFLINFIFGIYWLVKLRSHFLISTFFMLLGWSSIGRLIQFNFDTTPLKTEKETIKIMSFNVRLFDKYNWSNNKGTRNKILNLIKDENPDIICFQEFYYKEEKGHFTRLDGALGLNKEMEYHGEHNENTAPFHFFGKATFSKFPIVNRGIIDFKNHDTNTCIYTDININGDTIRVFNTHLASIHFEKQDYDYLKNISNANTEQNIEGSKNIINRLKKGWLARASQADMIATEIPKSPYPVIICGDFNDVSNSYTYHTISNGLIDAFIETGNGLGTSFNGTFPAFRIDFILHDKNIKTANFETIKKKVSDHYPISCEFVVENKKQKK